MTPIIRPLSLALMMAAAPPALAQMGAQVDGISGADLVAGGQLPDGRLLAALHISLTPEWKTYWRRPGEGGGIPPQFDWAGSENLASASLIWPTPEVWYDFDMLNIGYHNQMVVPIAITPKDAALPVSLALGLDMGVCKDICVPARVVLTATVQASAPRQAMIDAAMANQPTPATAIAGVSWHCTALPIKDGLQVTAIMTLPEGSLRASSGRETVVIEHNRAEVWASPAQVSRQGATLVAVADLVPPTAAPFDLHAGDLRLTVMAAGKALDMQGCPLK